MRPELLNSLTLAYLGDAVFEVYVREYLIEELGVLKVNDLQKEAVRYVSAKGQAGFMNWAIEHNLLKEEEIQIYKRGRNTKGRTPKNGNILEHNQSTGFECIIGSLYISDHRERLLEIFNLYNKYIQESK